MNIPGASVQPKIFSTVCKCPRGTNPRVCGWWGRKFSTVMAATQADINAITCIEGSGTTQAPPSSTAGPTTPTTLAPTASTSTSSFDRAECISMLTSFGHSLPEESCDAIILHNTYRANHNAPSFTIPSATLCQGAQDWADAQADAITNGQDGMNHATNLQNVGENLAWLPSGGFEYSMSEATESWQKEDVFWDFNNHQECTDSPTPCPSCSGGENPGSFSDCGHFTQNIWKSTTTVCVAKAIRPHGTYIVARYEPAGNMFGEFLENVEGPLNGNTIGGSTSTAAPTTATTNAGAGTTNAPSTFTRAQCITQLTADNHAVPEEACDAIILLNSYRANHNAPALGIPSASLCQGAQNYADSQAQSIFNAAGDGMAHSANTVRPGIGENLAWQSTSDYTLSAGTTAWQSEDAYWNFDDHADCNGDPIQCPACVFGKNPGSFLDCGHFTQNVWKATTTFCPAKATNAHGTVIVGWYEPTGNFAGEFMEQVDGQGPLNGVFVGTPHNAGFP
ncbi:Oidioi.mRNA.OKI2018_I69.chr2.g4738.t1.cds [Oikopleura dioica]|uniref:Oidioi.mRNA.OKI2018_I69.chr2.g4738.t1.cds n=1 Tax=Oikopleura dioica TaxID=34765 RepID=A0ABN7SYD3_OIKDI|nr:Oidioi.mRNA.OKI2018_I69.chr2.g4738.t1.cds [Oikopleura dioica]